MLTIVYDPDHGPAVPDNVVESWVDTQLVSAASFTTSEVVVGTNDMVDEFRLRVVKGELDHTQMQFKFKEDLIAVNACGGLSSWPKGMCDHMSNRLIQIARRRRSERG